jgi:hypothetical protein
VDDLPGWERPGRGRCRGERGTRVVLWKATERARPDEDNDTTADVRHALLVRTFTGRYQFPAGHVVGHHGVWGAFAFWSPELDATITGTVNTARIDRRPLIGAIMRAVTG